MYKFKHLLVNTIILIFVMCVLLTSQQSVININNANASINNNIEQHWREQARTTLNQLRNKFVRDMNAGIVNPIDEFSMQKWANENLSGVLNGGPTSDAFMINLQNEKFLWDDSSDCAKVLFIINGRFMLDEVILQKPSLELLKEKNISEFKTVTKLDYKDIIYIQKKYPEIYQELKNKKYILHNDIQKAEIALNRMRELRDTTSDDNFYWLFDDSPEWLEWIVIPAGTEGFNNEPLTIGGIKNDKCEKVLIVLGTQKDEIMRHYDKQLDKLQYAKKQIYFICTLTVLSSFIFTFYYTWKRKD